CLDKIESPTLAVAFELRLEAAFSSSYSAFVEAGFTGLLPPLRKMPGMPAGSITPASYGKAGYMEFTRESFGPAKAFWTAATCEALRQLSAFAPLQVRTDGLKLQAAVLKIIPSFKPSFSSH